ncbi:VacJ family lipoprotein [uncultured Microbulbifer sp.]|uniref:MlaA family lipoprotein n=1 Tax=uncultured Microbulbifer sp. TaxID=348147 RepID=UPI0025F4EC6E|nr:VacJ family lipoprotein [uncultured Microbulbifer sp.]
MLVRTHTFAWVLSALIAAPLAMAQDAPDPFDSDPFGESPAEPTAAPGEAPADSGSDAETTGAPGASEDAADAEGGEGAAAEDGAAVDDFGSELEDEYGFDPAGEFASTEEPEERDPWEGFNRAMFRFNDTADRWILKPVAVSYRQVTPIFMQTGFSNFFSNLHEINNILNSALQWKWGQAGNDSGRFLVNSTVGLGGLFDVARHMGLDPSDGEDFGQTLAVWGVPSGPYMVLPLMGPSSVRDAPASVVEWYTNPITYVNDGDVEAALKFLDVVQTRASLLQAEALLKGDRYVLMRDAYLQRREYLINDGATEDDFGGDMDEYDF